jgi:transposase
VFACGCGLIMDRDVNAAVNLARWVPAPSLQPSASPPQPAAA